MKQFLTGVCAIIWASVAAGQVRDDEVFLKPAVIHPAIREAAAKVEEKFRGTREEADGLTRQVEEILTSSKPPAGADADLNLQRALAMRLLSMQTGASVNLGSVRGFVFDDSKAGHQQHYAELEQEAKDQDVLHWLEMRHAARKLEWADKETLCYQRALGAVRALISREPKSAEAHALLAETLKDEGGPEFVTAVQSALRLDAKQPRAAHLLLERRMGLALESAVLRREVGLDEKVPDLRRQLFARPLDENEALAFGKQQEALRREAEALLKVALQRGDLAAYLATIQDLQLARRHDRWVELSSSRPPDATFEAFERLAVQAANESSPIVLASTEHLRSALRIAGGDPEALGSIIFIALMGDMMMAATGKPLVPERLKLADDVLKQLVTIAQTGNGAAAARASEAACVIQFGFVMLGRPVQHADMILQAIRLDPLRVRLAGLLLALCLKQRDVPGVYAMARIQLALQPGAETRRICAASAASMHDWPAAHRLMDACLKDKPNDVSLLNQRFVTLLRENQSKATQKKTSAIFARIRSLHEQQADTLAEDDRVNLAHNRVLFLAICGKNEEAKAELATVVREGVLTPDAGDRLGKLVSGD